MKSLTALTTTSLRVTSAVDLNELEHYYPTKKLAPSTGRPNSQTMSESLPEFRVGTSKSV
jgi:hypothetical protein